MTRAGIRRFPLVTVFAAVAAGAIADRYLLTWPAWGWWSLAVVAWMGWAWLWVRRATRRAEWILLLACASAMGAWHHSFWNLYPRPHLLRYLSADVRPVCLEGVAATSPVRSPAPPLDPLQAIARGETTRLRVQARRLRYGRGWVPVTGRVQVHLDGQLPGVDPGAELRIFGQLYQASPAGNPGQREARHRDRSARTVAHLHVSYPACVTVRQTPSGWQAWCWLPKLRAYALAALDRHVGPRQDALAAAMLLGARERLVPDQTEAFFQTGTVHLLAISGLHVGILAWAFFFVARCSLAARKPALVAVMVLTVVYAVMTEARAPVVRATILVQVVCLGLLARRPPLAVNSLAAAALVVLVLRPAELFRAGAQLSFLAVATLAWLGQVWQVGEPADALARLVRRSRPWYARWTSAAMRYLARLLLASGAICLVTLPLVMHEFHLVTPVAVLLNVVLWIPVAVALLAGFGVLLWGWLLPPLSAVCGLVCEQSLSALQSCVQLVHPWPLSHFWVAGPPAWWVGIFYAALAAGACLPAGRVPRRWWLVLLLWWCALLPMVGGRPSRGRRETLDCTFLAVGHGACVVLELPSGQHVLYDAGSMGPPDFAADLISRFLWSRGIGHLDGVILSHADSDHYNALPALLDRFSIGAVYVSPHMFHEDSPALDLLSEAIREAKIPLHEIWGDHRWHHGGVQLEVLHPLRASDAGNDNANSIVLEVSFAGRRVLLPGDLEAPGLQAVMSEWPRDCDVLMAPHHGSTHRRQVDFARWCSPEWLVISGSRSRARQATRAARRRPGPRVLHTALRGAVMVNVGRDRLDVRAWRP
jgi:competence protein ComEC